MEEFWEGAPAFVETHTYDLLRTAVEDGDSPILLTGPGGSGKSTLLRALARQTRSRRLAPLVDLGRIVDSEDLLDTLHGMLCEAGGHAPTGSRAFVDRLDEIGAILKEMPDRPLILLDGWDELRDRGRADRIYYGLALRTDAQIVISSRIAGDDLRRIRHREIRVAPFTKDEVRRLISLGSLAGVDASVTETIERISGGSPLLTQLLLKFGSTSGDLQKIFTPGPSIANGLTERLVERSIRERGSPEEFDLAVAAAILERPIGLGEAAEFGVDPYNLSTGILVRGSGGLCLAHRAFRGPILTVSRMLPPGQWILRDLRFGAEEAERDMLLKDNFVDLPGFEEVVSQGKRIVVGDRGTGKSAMFTQLVEESRMRNDCDHVKIVPIAHPADMLRRLEANGEQLATAEQFKAGWLTLFAYACAIEVQKLGRSELKRIAAVLVRTLAPGTSPVTGWFRQTLDRIGGLSVKINLGPIAIEPKASSPGLRRKIVDLPAFINSASALFSKAGIELLVPVDRIDEIHKYDRSLQEKAVQGLFLAESQLAQTSNLSTVIFIRSDLFNTYDIQEKNKLTSRRVVIKWTKPQLLEFAAKRVLSNPQFANLHAFIQRVPKLGTELAMKVMFPDEVEGFPIEEWLWRSMENGNSDVSARQIILLLTLATQAPSFADEAVSLPIFPAGALRSAMDSLSESSFRELIDDFRVAPTFLANARAGNLTRFSPAAFQNLFDEAEGPRNVLVDLLVRLGFLKRIVTGDGVPSAEFVVPQLYTRAWRAEGNSS